VSCRYDPHIDVNLFFASNGLHCLFFQDPQKLNLQIYRHVTDLVKKQSPVVSQLKSPRAITGRPSKRAFFMTKELAFEELCRNCTAIYRHKRLRKPL
jgi:hypothetical protein